MVVSVIQLLRNLPIVFSKAGIQIQLICQQVKLAKRGEHYLPEAMDCPKTVKLRLCEHHVRLPAKAVALRLSTINFSAAALKRA
jgi:hypothetical protein